MTKSASRRSLTTVIRPSLLWSRPALPTVGRFSVSRCDAATSNRSFQTCACLREKRHDIFSDGSRKSAVSKSTLSPVGSSAAQEACSGIAFAFDIDGVLYRGKEGIPGAKETLRNLRAQEMRYVFLTNGGGTHENAKAASLAKRLGLSEDEDVVRNRIILSHTPMRGWNDDLKQRGTVLITGSHPETARKIANEYGFERAVTPADLLAANGNIYPFAHLRDSLHSVSRPLPDGKVVPNLADPYSTNVPADALKIDQILVWNDPRDWSLDIQIIHDALISHRGYLGTISAKNGNVSLVNNGWQQDGQPELWISNLDLFWKTEFPINRFGTGAFVDALRGVWSAVTDGTELQYNALGKPSKFTYSYAHERLLHDTGNRQGADGKMAERKTPLRRVYMIGDNPESDIRGANEFTPEDGTEWVSILVKTGVWSQTVAEREPRHRPAVIVDDVVDAVVWALRNEGVDATRKWLLSGGS